jgi:hypothetical protein
MGNGAKFQTRLKTSGLKKAGPISHYEAQITNIPLNTSKTETLVLVHPFALREAKRRVK